MEGLVVVIFLGDPIRVHTEKYLEFVEYEQILVTYNQADIAIIKSIFDAENILYYFNAEHFMQLGLLAEPSRLMVAKKDAEMAREILRDLDL